MNQYIYFSSQGNLNTHNTHSDFEVKFSNPINVPAYGEVRCVNCRVNPNNNVYQVVKNENDKIAFGVGKFWIDQNIQNNAEVQNSFPLFQVEVPPGIYSLVSGTNDEYHFNAVLEKAMNDAVSNIPMLRGGVDVEIDANKILTVKVSPMNNSEYYYSVPNVGSSISIICNRS